MLNFQENKNLFISSFIIIIVFSILLLVNINNLIENEITLIRSLSIANTKFNLIIIFVILPSLIFLLLQKLLLNYLNFLWSSSISALSIFSYSGYDFKQFIYSIFINFNEIKGLAPKKIILFEYPNISITILIFLILILICFRLNRFNFNFIISITSLWSFFSFISFSGSIFGILFWLIYSSIKIFRQKKGKKQNIFNFFLLNLIFYVLFLYLFKNYIFVYENEVKGIYNFSLGYFLFYFVGPVVSILFIYLFYKIDLYEIFIKFTPLYVLMLSDFLYSIYLANYVIDYQNHEYFIYPHFILHFLYIIPIIYYLNKPLSPFIKNKNDRIF